MLAEVVVIVSVLLQFVAAILALRLIRTTNTRLAWSLIAIALIGMEIRRIMSLAAIHMGQGAEAHLQLEYELIGLVTSASLLGGIAAIKPIFIAIARMQEKIQRSEERYRTVVTQSLEGILIFEADTARVVESNPAFQEMIGYTAEELKKMNAFDLIAHDRAEIRENIEKIISMGSLGIGERSYMRKNGLKLSVLASASLLERKDGRPLICVVAHDLTEIKNAKLRLESTISELEDALDSVKTLEGLLPICANCKKIRQTAGNWVGIETYVKDHSNADFTHSICPDCISELYPGM
ncbi:PAS domain S-box protein [bacterium]|nr:MAG: PAS domain S-box protein [bacterium]